LICIFEVCKIITSTEASILCCSKNGKYRNSVEVYQSLGGAINDYKTQCEYSIVLHSAGELDDAYMVLCQVIQC